LNDEQRIIQKFIDGVGEEEQLEENCKFCEFFNICKYKKAPITVIDEEEYEDGD